MIKAEVIRDQDQVIELLTDKQQVIGMFQNGSEWGPRALGNRSILFDPTNPNAKQIVNTIEEHLNTLATLAYKPLKSEARGKKLVYIRGIIVDDSKKIPDVNLLWKLAKDKKGNFLVLDLEIEGISLVSSHKAETMSILRKNKGDFNALLGTFTKSE